MSAGVDTAGRTRIPRRSTAAIASTSSGSAITRWRRSPSRRDGHTRWRSASSRGTISSAHGSISAPPSRTFGLWRSVANACATCSSLTTPSATRSAPSVRPSRPLCASIRSAGVMRPARSRIKPSDLDMESLRFGLRRGRSPRDVPAVARMPDRRVSDGHDRGTARLDGARPGGAQRLRRAPPRDRRRVRRRGRAGGRRARCGFARARARHAHARNPEARLVLTRARRSMSMKKLLVGALALAAVALALPSRASAGVSFAFSVPGIAITAGPGYYAPPPPPVAYSPGYYSYYYPPPPPYVAYAAPPVALGFGFGGRPFGWHHHGWGGGWGHRGRGWR